MALDVHLKRMGNSTWEFRLIGKKGFNISVTEAQAPERRRKIPIQEEVVYSSPSTESSDEESQPSQEVTNGLYDPVLDDTEVIYETIEPADSDQRSNQLEQPTEVQFEVKQFTDQPDLTRSLTSSPFLISTKPYRPFSTEPLEIPPVEDPIILNPCYHDIFPSDEIEEPSAVTKFKLPISEQYDPNIDINKEITLVNNKIYVVQSDKTAQSKQVSLSEKKSADTMILQVDKKEYKESLLKKEQQEFEYLEKIKTEIDLEKIEATAVNVVDESIQQAITVAEDIKKEIDIELKEIVQEESHTETVVKESTQAEMKSKEGSVTQKEESITGSKIESSVHEQRSDSQKQTLSITEIKEAEKVIKDLPEIVDETTDKKIQQKESINIEMDETNKVLEEKTEISVSETKHKHDKQASFEKSTAEEENEKIAYKSNLVESSELDINKSDVKTSENKAHGPKMTTSKLLSEQRAYTIGLQTIPNIRGSIQSSYHYDLLLKTFFVHLTDVMVALSRFILTEPVTIAPNKDASAIARDITESNIKAEKQTVSKKTLKEETIVSKDIQKDKTSEEDTQKHRTISNAKNIVNKTATLKDEKISTLDTIKVISENNHKNLNKHYNLEEIVTDDVTRHELMVEEGELIRKRKLSGAKIAQIEGRKPADLTNRMDKVISEFQRKSGTSEVINREEYVEDHRRSRSRSRVGEEIIHENVSLENISQEDNKKKSMQVIEAKSEKCLTEFGVTKYEGRENENLKRNENGKVTYVAIVEAHVYTNKDAIFEEQMRRMSESSKAISANYKSDVTSKSSEVKKMTVIKDAALQKTIDVIVPSVHIETEKKVNVMQAHATIQTPVKSIASKTSVSLEEESKIIKQNQLISKKSHVLIEKPKIVAEKTETFTEGKIEIVEVPKVITQSSKQVIEAPVKTVAEIKKVFINEEQAVTIETPELNIVKPKSSLDATVMPVAQKTEVVVSDNIENFGTVQSKPTKQANVVVNESVATVVTEISPLEPKDEILEVPETFMKQSQAVIEEPVFHIPETAAIICLEESKVESELPKVTTSNAKVQVEEVKVASQATIVALEKIDKEFEEKSNIVKKNATVRIAEPAMSQAEVQTVKVEDAKCEITNVTESTKKSEEVNIEYTVELPKEHEKTLQEESAEIKITKYEIIEVTPPEEVYEDFDFSVKKVGVEKELSQTINIHEQSTDLEASKTSTIQSGTYEKAHAQSEQHMSKSEQNVQLKQSTKMAMQSQESKYKSAENSVTVSHAAVSQKDYQAHAQSDQKKLQHVTLQSIESSTSQLKSEEKGKLTLRTDLTERKSVKANGEHVTSPSSTSVPPTPLVDEYVFKLQVPLPKSRGTTPVPRDCSVTPPSDHEDPDIVKKKLVPQIVDTNIEQVVYDPPLPTPTPTSPEKKSPPKYVKPGLRGGSDRPEMTKDEIMEIERKSSLLTSAIDETIRSIEEYKESVGIDIKQEIVEEHIKTEYSSEIESEKYSEQSEKVIVSNGHVEENEQEFTGSEDEQHEITIEEPQNNVDMDETEQSIEETVVFNGKISNGTEYEETINGEKHDDVVETVTINLSKIKRDSLQETNVSTTMESTENKEDMILNGDVKIGRDNFESVQSYEINSESENTRFSSSEVEITEKPEEHEKSIDPLQGYRSVEFNPEAYKQRKQSEMHLSEQITWEGKKIEVYKTDSGDIIGSQQGIIDGLEEPVVDPEIAKVLGKPGMPEQKIAELISGEADMLREAHVMGLERVLKSHMHRTDDCSDDFMKIKPSIETLKDSEVLKALNEEILRSREVKMKEERKWTTFLQKPVPKPKQKVVFCGNKEDALNYNFENLSLDDDTSVYGNEPYRVRIVKQPKPRIAPDFKPEDFDTGPLPWEQRAVTEEKEADEAPPVEPEDPILIPEEVPEFVEAVDPLPESEVPDLEDTGIPLPPSPLPQELPTFALEEPQYQEAQEYIREETEGEESQAQEAGDNLEEMDKKNVSNQLMANIENMVDPNATLEEQLAQMRSQLAALAQLPNVIQQTLELVTKQICQISQQKTVQTVQQISESQDHFVDAVANFEETQTEKTAAESTNEIVHNNELQEEPQEVQPSLSEEEMSRIHREEEERMIEEQTRLQQQKKELIEQMRIEQESRQVKQRSTPRVGKPRPMFGPPVPVERPVVLPGGRKWRKPEDAYNEQRINEALTAQAEIDFWNNTWPWCESENSFYRDKKYNRVNFMKYEKPPVSLDHLQQSEVYKVIHNMDQTPLKKVELLTPVIAEAEYRERKMKSRFSPVSSVANTWPSRGCTPSPQSEVCNSVQ